MLGPRAATAAVVGAMLLAGVMSPATASTARWQQVHSGNPRPGTSGDVLSAVTCNGHSCVAVGSAGNSALVEQPSKHGTWVAKAVLHAGSNVKIDAVSCPAVGRCRAVGYDDNDVLALTEQGSAWRLSTIHVAGKYPSLAGISCWSPSRCIAVGQRTTAQGYAPVAIALSHGKWRSESKGVVANGVFNAVDCLSGSACYAAGASIGTESSKPLVQMWNGSRWRRESVAVPNGDTQVVLDGITCSGKTECFAVGNAENADTIFGSPVIESLTRSSWSVTFAGSDKVAALMSAITCQHRCLAVGTRAESNGDGAAYILGRTSRGWTAEPVKQPKYSPTVNGVACVAAHRCYAVGSRSPSSTTSKLATLVLTGE